mmetsp:Transcript_12218/g.47234  ORF Transcript_12218/g.47234 Transcript_12218/m.47234 type:complete len:223 (+) Transcript_12218:415-1083(+)
MNGSAALSPGPEERRGGCGLSTASMRASARKWPAAGMASMALGAFAGGAASAAAPVTAGGVTSAVTSHLPPRAGRGGAAATRRATSAALPITTTPAAAACLDASSILPASDAILPPGPSGAGHAPPSQSASASVASAPAPAPEPRRPSSLAAGAPAAPVAPAAPPAAPPTPSCASLSCVATGPVSHPAGHIVWNGVPPSLAPRPANHLPLPQLTTTRWKSDA